MFFDGEWDSQTIINIELIQVHYSNYNNHQSIQSNNTTIGVFEMYNSDFVIN